MNAAASVPATSTACVVSRSLRNAGRSAELSRSRCTSFERLGPCAFCCDCCCCDCDDDSVTILLTRHHQLRQTASVRSKRSALPVTGYPQGEVFYFQRNHPRSKLRGRDLHSLDS